MAGKLCIGSGPSNNSGAALLQESKAYCEGRAIAKSGGLIGDNPHDASTPAGMAWATGFSSYTANPVGRSEIDCCAIPYGEGYTP